MRGGLGASPFAPEWGTVREVHGGSSEAVARIGVRPARAGHLVDAYPAGTRDRELALEGDVGPSTVAAVVDEIFAADPQCRRVILPVPVGDLEAIAWAEDAGFRFVVDVDTRSGSYSLLVVEPGWVLAQPSALEDIPIQDGAHP